MTDSDVTSTTITLTVDEGDISKEAPPTEVVVTATLNGKTLIRALTFNLVIVAPPTNGDNIIPPATRDVDYSTGTTLGSITIPRRQESGTTTITVTPKNADTVGDVAFRLTASVSSPS